MTSGTAQAQAHAKQRQKAHFATAQSKRRAAKGEPQKQGLLVILSVSEVSTKLKRGFFATLKMTSGTAQARAHAKRRQKRPLQHKFLVANSLLKELAAQKRKGHEMKKLLVLITLVLFSAGFITEAFAAPARGGGNQKSCQTTIHS